MEREKREGNWRGNGFWKCWDAAAKRRFCAAPPVRRPTEGARVSGDGSLFNLWGPRKIGDFVGKGKRERVIWQGEFLRFFRKSGAFAEKISYNSPGTERSTFCWEMTEPRAREESLLRALSDREVRMMGALPPTTRPAEVQPAKTRADLYRALPIS